MGLDFTGLDDLIKKLDEAEKKMPNASSAFLAQEAELVRGHAAELTPVDTGRLREGWKASESHDGKVDVYNNTEYAAHQEYGHRVKVHGKFTGKFVKGRHMLRDGLRESQETFKQDAADILKGLMS